MSNAQMVEFRVELDPEPAGTSPTACQARCPGIHHYLYVGNAFNITGCGWCKCKGGPDELEAFVAERTRPASPADSHTRHGGGTKR